ncbi:MAG: response regulator [Cyanobacteria bacterium P01_C01_bin.70]
MRSSISANLEKIIQISREEKFTGLICAEISQESQWLLYLLSGHIVWANGRDHSVRRWYRQVLRYAPEVIDQISNQKNVPYQSWNYNALAKLVRLRKFRRSQFSSIVQGCITEVLFDIVHQGNLDFQSSKQLLHYKRAAKNAADMPFIMLHTDQAWKQAQQDWQAWKKANLIDFHPNQAPVIVESETLRKQTSERAFQTLTELANSNQTLRDLALKVQQPLVSLTQSLAPYIQQGAINLIEVKDSVAFPSQNEFNSSASQAFSASGSQTNTIPATKVPEVSQPPKVAMDAPMIVYIDDNPSDSHAMAQIVKSLGYRYTNIPDPLQALPRLLELKPEFIFLDLVMPIANGYELCAQIRRISAFKDIPIVIVTNNDGIGDRVRAKVVGSSDFLGKPIQPERVSKALRKHLKPTRASPPSRTHPTRQAFT